MTPRTSTQTKRRDSGLETLSGSRVGKICCNWPVPVFQEWMIRTKSRLKILKILSAAPSNSTTSISSNGNSVNPSVPLMLLHAEQTINSHFLFQPSKCERTQRRVLHDPGARGLTQQPHVVLVSAPHQPAGGANAVPHHCCQRDPGDHRRQSGEHELNGVDGLDRQDTVLHSLAVDYAVSIPTLHTSASWILFFSNNQSVFQRKGQWIVLVYFYFLPLPASSGWGRCFFPLTAFVKPLSLKLDSQEGVCLTTDGLWQSLLGCSVFRSVSLIDVRRCSTRHLTFIYVLLLLCRDDIP